MEGLKPTYKIDFCDWLKGQDLSGYEEDAWTLSRHMIGLLFDVGCNDVYEPINLEWYDDELSFDFAEDRFKDAIPLVIEFFKEMKSEGINEILVDISW